MWRPRFPADVSYCSLGDLVTTRNCPPVGVVVVREDQCKPPTSYKKVLTSSKLSLSVLRPVPPEGYACLGDVVLDSSSGSAASVPAHACGCLPLWALRDSRLGAKMFHSKKGGGDTKHYAASLWAVANDLGTFFGSPSDSQRLPSGASSPDGIDVTGVGRPLTLKIEFQNITSGEWTSERDVSNAPSLSWSKFLLEFLLDDPSSRKKVLRFWS